MSGFLSIRKVTKRFSDVTAVSEVSLSVDEGEVLSLLGPSGCGKTTLLRMIAGFEDVDGGTIELGGRMLSDRGGTVAPDKRKVGLVFQDFALFPHLTVEANIAFGVPRKQDKKARVRELLETVHLSGLGGRMPHELSGGQQQRVALARTLAAEPELVLLDEPFSNLDPAMRGAVRNEVLEILSAFGTTAIIVTHDQDEALSLPGRVAVMLKAEMRQVGEPGEIYRTPADRELAEFVGDANFLPGMARNGEVECALGRVPAPGAMDGPVDLMIRPENLRFEPFGEHPADIMEFEYFGHDQLVTASLEGGEAVKVRQIAGTRLEPGTKRAISICGEVMVYPRR